MKVIYSPASLSENALRVPPSALKTEFLYRGFKLEPTLDLTAPAQDVWEIESLELDAAESDVYGEIFAQVCPTEETIHRMGGYPNLVQYGDLERTGAPDAADWKLLLQLDSDRDVGLLWGDAGRLFFMIREKDLKSLSFEKAWMDWQCG
jgi:uncharacterized protein YwqG